ncbi:MAG: chromosome segregation SMC family protein, partial [Hyphomicrobiales bacterium]
MEFKRLRLSGFKSFVEPTELLIEPGLTGVVGPNGCGKSNLLEAIRWVMGESSYKRMRASGMEDVIFSGSADRPERNMAEVVVTLDNSGRTAPAAFNDADTLEISRRIEREAGSAYRINGKDARAKDVQLLFADASTGSRSPALVRQGQIGEIVNAKPQARRRILEEAAGITGLYTRRHEAELRLNAAETNLVRLEDVIGQLEIQLNNLKRQARQATRYKNVSADIRRTEASQLYIQWRQASDALQEAEAGLRDSERALGEHTREAAEATRLQADTADALPPLREQEAVRAAVLHRLTVERDGLEAEQQRTNARKEELETRLRQIAQDLRRERGITEENDGVLQRLADEEATLTAANTSDADARAEAEQQVGRSAQTLHDAEREADEAAASLSALQTRKAGLEGAAGDLRTRMARLETELGSVTGERERLDADHGLSTAIDGATSDLAEAQDTLAAAERAVETAEADHEAKRDAEAAARSDADTAGRDAERLRTEVATLEKVLSVPDDGQWPPVVDAVTVTGGYEAALGAALGDDLDVPADEAAPVHWRTLTALSVSPTLPGGARPLADFVKAPPALARRLTQVGVVDSVRGAALQAELGPGQRLVSTAGDLWRWDGFSAAADAPTAAAQRLAERNRLDGLRGDARSAVDRAEAAQQAFDTAQAATRQIAERLANNRGALRQANQAVAQARDTLAGRERANAETNARTAALNESERRIVDDIAQVTAGIEKAEAELGQIPPADALTESLQRLRETVTNERAAYTEIKARFDGFERDAAMR